MKIIEVINEATDSKAAAKAAAKLYEHCAPWIAAVGNPEEHILFRGIYSNSTFSHQPCPVNREPRDTEIALHKIVDDVFFKKTGIRFRSNATFGTGDIWDVENYGKPFTLFAAGEFKICWSPVVRDMTYGMLDGVRISDFIEDKKINYQEIEAHIDELIRINKYQMGNLVKAIESHNEVMVHAPAGFYLLKYSNGNDKAEYFHNEVMSNLLELMGAI